MTHPLAAFVAGVQGGIQFRHGLQDRKDDKARQKKMDQITFDREARAAGEYDWQMGERRRARGLEDAASADAQAASAATQESLAGDGAAAPAVATTSPAGTPPSPVARGVAQQLGLSMTPQIDPAAAVMQQTMPAEMLAGGGGAGGGPQAQVPAGPTQAAAARIARPAQFEPGPQQQPVSFEEWWKMSRGQRKAMGIPVSEAGMRMQGESAEPNSRRVLREAREASQGRAPMPDGAAMVRRGLVGDPSVPMGLRRQAAERQGMDPALLETVPSPEQSITSPAAAGPTKARAAEQAATGTAAVQAAPPAAQDAAQAGAAAATKGKGFTPGQPVTPEQKKRGTSAFMDRYMEVGAPMVVEGMVKRGDIKGAMAFMQFIEAAETKKAMQTWANAAFSASVGDLDGFVDNVVDLYNDAWYFPDDTSIVKDASKVVKDRETGQPVGALITFKDDKTGNTWEQIITDDDLMAPGITAFAPENAFEYWRQKQDAAAERTRGLAKSSVDTNKAIADMAIKLMESAPVDAPMTFEDAQIKAAQALGLGSVAGSPSGPPPVAYRP